MHTAGPILRTVGAPRQHRLQNAQRLLSMTRHVRFQLPQLVLYLICCEHPGVSFSVDAALLCLPNVIHAKCLSNCGRATGGGSYLCFGTLSHQVLLNRPSIADHSKIEACVLHRDVVRGVHSLLVRLLDLLALASIGKTACTG
jgi:hypothetical protein